VDFDGHDVVFWVVKRGSLMVLKRGGRSGMTRSLSFFCTEKIKLWICPEKTVGWWTALSSAMA
jgi:hypothetical protein